MNPDDIAIYVMRGLGTCMYYGTLAEVPFSEMRDAPVFTYTKHRDLIQGMEVFSGVKLDLRYMDRSVYHRVPAKAKTAGMSRPRYYLIGIHPNNMDHYKNHVGLKSEGPEKIFRSDVENWKC